jgi:hypothetical protein
MVSTGYHLDARLAGNSIISLGTTTTKSQKILEAENTIEKTDNT